MKIVVAVVGALLVIAILRDAFESLILPYSVRRRFRPARVVYVISWRVWTALAALRRSVRGRETFLIVFGPFSILVLLAFWAFALILGFAMLHYGIGSLADSIHEARDFGVYMYLSGSTFFTLGLGDVVPNSSVGRFLTVIEAGTGFGFLAAVISYLPVFYQAFSRRELGISLLDARAGSPPTAEVLLRREGRDPASLERLLRDWERWAAELMESHISYPALAFYRSQHQNQSWLAAITTILDASAFAATSLDGDVRRQARRTFAMSRHAIVDLAQVFRAAPTPLETDRLTPEQLRGMCTRLIEAGVRVRTDDDAESDLGQYRRMYEPYVKSLGARFRFNIPAWSPASEAIENWRTSAWEKAVARHRDADLHEDLPN